MPICPKCKVEYRDGFTICADCKVPLVKSLEESGKLTEDPDESYFMSFDQFHKLVNDDDLGVTEDDINSTSVSQEVVQDAEISSQIPMDRELTPEQIEKIKAELIRQKMAESKKEEYVSKKEKSDEYLSSGIMLIIMGILGCTFIALLVFGVLPFKVNGIISYVIDGILFLFFGMFIYFGIHSLYRYNEFKKASSVESHENEEFEEWFKKTITKQFIDSDIGITEDEQMNFFKRNAKIKYIISQQHPEVSEGLADLYIDKYYGDIFE